MAHAVIDLSSYQHPQVGTNADGSARSAPIDYEQVFAHLDAVGKSQEPHESGDQPLVIVKLTELSAGGAYVNPFAAQDIEGFRKAGCAVAGYLFFHPDVDVTKQVALARSHLNGVTVVLVDSEVGGAGSSTQGCMQQLRDDGLFTGLYADLSEVQGWAGAPWDFPLFLAEYGVSQPSIPCAAWQTGNTDPVPGIDGAVDHDIWYGGREPKPWGGLWNKWFGSTVVVKPVDPDPLHYPDPLDPHAGWEIVLPPGTEFSFWLVNLHTGSKHPIDNPDLLREYLLSSFIVTEISMSELVDLKQV